MYALPQWIYYYGVYHNFSLIISANKEVFDVTYWQYRAQENEREALHPAEKNLSWYMNLDIREWILSVSKNPGPDKLLSRYQADFLGRVMPFPRELTGP